MNLKYLSGLSGKVSGDDGRSGFPSDQLIRNIRVGLHRSGYFSCDGELFAQSPRDLIVLVMAPTKDHPLVKRYRDPRLFREAIPHSDQLIGTPRSPFVGELSYADLASLLRCQSRWFSRPERQVIDALTAYLEYKLTSNPAQNSTWRTDAASRETAVPRPTQSTGPTFVSAPST
jgi:hypothetical protein